MSRSPPVLADISWRYRRIFAYGATIINAVLLGASIWRLHDVTSLRRVALALIGANIILTLLYLAGATTTDIARLAQAARGKPDEPEGTA